MRVAKFVATSLSIIALTGALVEAADAQTWPTQTVKIVTPFPPGSGGDITVRPIADGLAKRWGRPVIVENRPGADGIIALTAVLNANDGHTILYTNGGPLTSNQLAHAGQLPYDPVHDFLPISTAADVFVGIGVPSSLSAASLNDFVNLSKSRKGQFNWGGTPGSLDYLIPGFFKRAGLDLAHVSYRDVTSAMQDLSQGRLQLYAAAIATQLPMAQSGMVKIIAVTNKVRAPTRPDVPTAEEAGFSELRYEAFLGFFAPRGTPRNVRDRINTDVRAVGHQEELKNRFQTMGMKARVTSAAELERIVADERNNLARLSRMMPQVPAQ